MKRLALPVLLWVLAVAASCGGGDDTEEATKTCQDVRARQSQCVDDAAFAQCVACREECGKDCSQLESCPLQFTCD